MHKFTRQNKIYLLPCSPCLAGESECDFLRLAMLAGAKTLSLKAASGVLCIEEAANKS